ncbi:MAG: 50S ribosomal protein L15 [Candidatus Paceibacterota bacterium]|jgi:large subunit ribosomal protein L15
MQLHNLKKHSSHHRSKLIGRGGKRGTTSGRGTKGQKARAGNKRRPEMRDIIKKLPKLRGYRFKSIQAKPAIVNLATLDKVFKDGEVITPATLSAKKLIKQERGQIAAVKILATGELTKKLKFEGCLVSASAKAKIEQAGGSVLALKTKA